MKIDHFLIFRSSTIKEALKLIEKASRGLLILVNKDNIFERTITDGDLRRFILTGVSLSSTLENLPSKKSIIVPLNISISEVLEIMNKHYIEHLPQLDSKGKVVNIFFRKDIDNKILLSVPHIGEMEQDFVKTAFDTNWIAPIGPNVDEFEKELASEISVNYAAALSSGTAAIHLGLCILGVKKNDIVFCSTLTFAASAFPILYLGAEPVFIDSDEHTWNMCPKSLLKAFEKFKLIKKLPKAVIVVNLYGQTPDYDAIIEICNYYNVPILEDAAESLGSFYKDRPTGSIGKIGCLSFNGNKIITTSGGGMLVSNDKKIVDKAKFLSTQARENFSYYEHKEIGYNYRMSNILAGVGRGQLKVLKDRVNNRRQVFQNYKDSLSDIDEINFMPEPSWSRSNRWLSVLTLDKNSKFSLEKLFDILKEKCIEARPIWKPMHLQPIFKKSKFFSSAQTPISNKLFETGICLPSSSNLQLNQQNFIINVIRNFFNKK